ncbi:NAD(P)-dependent dehydrogenase (short-subunit alcohol dehydrogenase family) [Aliiruegeria haliotis]|uniref:Probable oxidoreductase n=1 Tax=Aliiruegeria haliotis TaxID=1280846 RepID=A0A2T0RYW9_9RHOB|nr:SDR family NAD(P)-dependent oxidoreductase [Aliiruegeria haliotis]PRY26386.1 NAD(P)-dependent dehydrogenase (short-subunit alcohol dehydrogenase family) [Aliiruegeria haliotis]
MIPNRPDFGFATTADEVLDGIDLAGKTVLITGGTSGLGAESARAMAAKGAHVIITARDTEKAGRALSALKDATGAEVQAETLELGCFASIRAFADRILARDSQIDILINNAGIMACDEARTEDGLEMQFGANHIGHFLMTNLIVPSLVSGGRVVSLSSSGHQISPVVFDDIQFETRAYNRWAAYGQAKTANALFAVGLNTRLAGRGIEAFAVHPGAIMTELARHMPDDDVAMFQERIDAGTLPMKTVGQGAATQVYAATAPEIAGMGGSFLADCGICPVDAKTEVQTVVRPYAVDPDLAERLWSVSEKIVGQQFQH